MGVDIFLLDRRTVTLLIGGSKQTVGTLRRFFKLTELDDERAAERDAASHITPSPTAALIMDITDLPLAGAQDKPVAAHLVHGWDDVRSRAGDVVCGYDRLAVARYDEVRGDVLPSAIRRVGNNDVAECAAASGDRRGTLVCAAG